MLLSLLIVHVFTALPSAVPAAVIFSSVLGLIRVGEAWHLRRWSTQQFVIAATTFVLTLALAPQIQVAIIVGAVLAIVAHLRRELAIAGPPLGRGGHAPPASPGRPVLRIRSTARGPG